MQILGLLGMHFDAVVVKVKIFLLLFRLALAILWQEGTRLSLSLTVVSLEPLMAGFSELLNLIGHQHFSRCLVLYERKILKEQDYPKKFS